MGDSPKNTSTKNTSNRNTVKCVIDLYEEFPIYTTS